MVRKCAGKVPGDNSGKSEGNSAARILHECTECICKIEYDRVGDNTLSRNIVDSKVSELLLEQVDEDIVKQWEVSASSQEGGGVQQMMIDKMCKRLAILASRIWVGYIVYEENINWCCFV